MPGYAGALSPSRRGSSSRTELLLRTGSQHAASGTVEITPRAITPAMCWCSSGMVCARIARGAKKEDRPDYVNSAEHDSNGRIAAALAPVEQPGQKRRQRADVVGRRQHEVRDEEGQITERGESNQHGQPGDCTAPHDGLIARATPWIARSRPSASARVRFSAFCAKLETKACRPSVLGGRVRKVCINAVA
jgi:hypothetical protein